MFNWIYTNQTKADRNLTPDQLVELSCGITCMAEFNNSQPTGLGHELIRELPESGQGS